MIGPFSGKYRFLSNFHPSPVQYEGVWYDTVEHGFQAAKFAPGSTGRRVVTEAAQPYIAKSIAKTMKLYWPDWDTRRLRVMLDLLRLKFAKGSNLAAKLEATGDEEIVEVNHWNDRYWGVCNGVGENQLGKLLMQVRQENRSK